MSKDELILLDIRFAIKCYCSMWVEENEQVKVCQRIVENISSGRKIFKFLKFLEPVRKIHDYHFSECPSQKPIVLKTL